MNKLEMKNQTLIASHAVLAGMTRFIPVPFVDDVVQSYVLRRLIRRLAESYGVSLGDDDAATLGTEPNSGCGGCVLSAVIYPLKWVLRKIFIFLEMKRAADLLSRVYHRGFLVEYAIQQKWVGADSGRSAADVRSAIDDVLREAPIRPVEEAAKLTFRQFTGPFKSAVRLLRSASRRLTRESSPDDVETVLETLPEAEKKQFDGLVASLVGRINAIPSDHFDSLRNALDKRMSQ
ncbi:MAG: hypothetical protein IPF53_10940 [Blastocatellia bacterium]|nr:hypothetical protein [Blastocatellia bacterium]MBK6428018.1 hypothetical protein [Blastocatellia bacterium]